MTKTHTTQGKKRTATPKDLAKSSKFTFGEGKQDDAAAEHAEDGDGQHHAVRIWNLHVFISPDGNGWFAQGFEIDYGVHGKTLEEAKKRFETGLALTIHHNLDIFGNIKNMLRPNYEFWEQKEEAKGEAYDYGFMSMHEIAPKAAPLLPFSGIEYEAMRGIAA